ncbi:MAG: hypothetical protein ACTTIX_03865 [Peptoanaerobacter stomatis]
MVFSLISEKLVFLSSANCAIFLSYPSLRYSFVGMLYPSSSKYGIPV